MNEKKRKKTGKGGRQKGTPKTGGRTKGTPNRNSLLFREGLDELDVNLIERVTELIEAIEDPREKLQEYKYLIGFAYPRLREIEVKGGQQAPDEPIKIDGQSHDNGQDNILELIEAAKGKE